MAPPAALSPNSACDYYWDSGSTLPDDGVTTFQVTGVLTGRWRLMVQAEVAFDTWKPAGDGIQDDYKKFVAALDYAKANNVTLVLNADKTYYIGTLLNYSFSGVLKIKSSSTTKKATLKLSDNYLFPFQLNAIQKAGTTTITTKINRGDKSVTVANGSGFSAGDYVGFSSTANWPLVTNSEVQKGEWNIVESVAGNELLLRHPVMDTYPATEKVKVSKWTYAALDLDGVEFVCADSGNKSTVGLSLRNLQNSRMTNCIVRNFQTTGVETRACYNFEFAYNQVFGTNEVGMGYGFYPLAGYKFSVHDNTFTGGRKGVDAGGAGTLGPVRDVSVYRNTTYGAGQTATKTDWFNLDVVGGQNMGYAVHEGAENVVFTDNASYNTCYGYQVRGKDVVVKNNTVYGMCNFPMTTLAGYNHTYDNNSYQAQLSGTANPDYKKYPRALFFSDAAAPGQLIIKNNKADFARDFGIVLDGSRVLADVTATDNQFLCSTIDASGSPFTVYWSHITKPVTKLLVRGNVVTMATSGVKSSTMRLVRDGSYKTGSLLDWASCDVEGLKADDVLTLSNKTSTSTLSYSFADMRVTKLSQSVRLTGKITFKSTVSCRPFLLGLPASPVITNPLFKYECTTEKRVYVAKLYSNAEIQFGKNETDLLDSFKASTAYSLSVDTGYTTN